MTPEEERQFQRWLETGWFAEPGPVPDDLRAYWVEMMREYRARFYRKEADSPSAFLPCFSRQVDDDESE